MTMGNFDAIVIGSGITGGWAAKELTERGLKVLMIERGPMIEHQTDYQTEMTPPWEMRFGGLGDGHDNAENYPVQSKGTYFDEWTRAHFVNDRENPYQTDPAEPFQWRRGYQVGGKSLIWGRQCYRLSDLDFGANAADGQGEDWPIRYADLAPWYDHVESFIGVSGMRDALPQLPDGIFQAPMRMNVVEEHLRDTLAARTDDRCVIIGRSANMTEAKEKEGRSACQNRLICARGCSYGAYFSTQSSTLPAARATGRLTILTDTVVKDILHDPQLGRAIGVETIDANTLERKRYDARVIFLCAGTINSVGVLLRSRSDRFPNGLGNDHDILGRYFMDHATAGTVARIPGFAGHTYFGNRPNGILIPRFRNIGGKRAPFLRGYSYQGAAIRAAWNRGANHAGLGAAFKAGLRSPGEWRLLLNTYAECLPNRNNRITLDPLAYDRTTLQQIRIDFHFGANEKALIIDAAEQAEAMLALVGGEIISSRRTPNLGGSAVHEMGGARMGRDPSRSMLDGFNRLHAVPNLFVTDGSAMASTACQNPSLTYMAMTARAAANAVSMLQEASL